MIPGTSFVNNKIHHHNRKITSYYYGKCNAVKLFDIKMIMICVNNNIVSDFFIWPLKMAREKPNELYRSRTSDNTVNFCITLNLIKHIRCGTYNIYILYLPRTYYV